MSETIVKNSMFQFDPSWLKALKAPVAIALAVALVAQLLLALLIGGGSAMAPAATDVRLLAFDKDAVTGIDIRAGNEADGEASGSLTLIRGADGWTLADLNGFPASDTRMQQLLDSLASLTRPLPVGTSSDARQRFKVADDDFERRITLRGDDGELVTLIVGDSPGFRRLFARVAGEDAVYDLRLALTDLSADSDDWIDRGRLQLDRGKVQRVSGADWILIRGDDGWQLQDSGQPPDADAVDDLLGSLTSLGYSGVLGTDAKPEYGLDTPAATFDIGLADGATRSYRVGALADSDDYVLKSDEDPYFYRLANFELSGLLDMTAATLLGEAVTELDDASEPTSEPALEPALISGSEPKSESAADPGTEPRVEPALDAESASSAVDTDANEQPAPQVE